MQPVTGPALVKSMRRASAGPVSLVPTMIMSVRAKPALVEQSLRAGAHQVLVLPTREHALPPPRLADQRRPRQALRAGRNGSTTVAQLSAPRLCPAPPNLASPAAAPKLESGRDLAKKARPAPR
jgi:hypothetical protein